MGNPTKPTFLLAACLISMVAAQILTQKTEITLFYNSLDPRAQKFLTKPFFQLITTVGSSNALNIHLNPFASGTYQSFSDLIAFKCPNGKNECLFNKYHACTLNKLNFPENVKLISCMEYLSTQKFGSNVESIAQRCIKKMNPDQYGLIKRCALGGEGKKLLLKYAKTAARNQITEEPTVIVNGKKLETVETELALTDFIKFGCEKGTFKKDSQMCKSYFEFLGSDEHKKYEKFEAEKLQLEKKKKAQAEKKKADEDL